MPPSKIKSSKNANSETLSPIHPNPKKAAAPSMDDTLLHSQEDEVQVSIQQQKDSSDDAAISRAMEKFLLSERAQ